MARLTMTKLVVADLERSLAFYQAVCGLRELRRMDAMLADRPVREAVLSGGEGSSILVLFQYLEGGDAVSVGETMLVFETDDLDGFIDRALAQGATILVPLTSVPAMGARYAYLRDPEGHILEGLERRG